MTKKKYISRQQRRAAERKSEKNANRHATRATKPGTRAERRSKAREDKQSVRWFNKLKIKDRKKFEEIRMDYYIQKHKENDYMVAMCKTRKEWTMCIWDIDALTWVCFHEDEKECENKYPWGLEMSYKNKVKKEKKNGNYKRND